MGGVQQIRRIILSHERKYVALMYGPRGKRYTITGPMVSRSELLSVLSISAKHDLLQHTVTLGWYECGDSWKMSRSGGDVLNDSKPPPPPTI